MTSQHIAFYVCATLLVSTAQSLLLIWRCWSLFSRIGLRLQRKLLCSWCWQYLHIKRWYPDAWSSSVCEYHSQKIIALADARRQRRLAAMRQAHCEDQNQVQEVTL